jgi:Restriction endonuclease
VAFRQKLLALLAAVDAADDAEEKGDTLEELMAFVLGAIPGITLIERNNMTPQGDEEIDIGVWNEQRAGALAGFDPMIIVECKNWSTPAGAPVLTLFAAKLRERRRPFGIFVAASGITGDAGALTAAHHCLATALADGYEIVVITIEELRALRSAKDVVLLLRQKRLQLALRRSSAA